MFVWWCKDGHRLRGQAFTERSVAATKTIRTPQIDLSLGRYLRAEDPAFDVLALSNGQSADYDGRALIPPVLPCISLSSFKDCHSLLMRHTISVLVENRFGVLARIAGMFSGRGFNIDSLNVAPTTDFSTSRMTIVVRGADTVLEQVTKQLNKLVDVIEIQDFRDGEYVDRELVMLRVKADSANRSEVMQICDIFRAKIVDVQPKRLAIEITGNESKITKFLKLMENFGISDLTRTGRVAMARAE